MKFGNKKLKVSIDEILQGLLVMQKTSRDRIDMFVNTNLILTRKKYVSRIHT